MARYFTLTKSGNFERGSRKRTLGQSVMAGPATLAIVAIVLCCLVSLFFLTQIFESSTKGYQVSALEEKVEELKDKNQELEIKAAELRSLDGLEKSVQEINMVPAENVVYLKKSESSVASAK